MPSGLAGFNWPNAGRTYLLHWDQGPPPTQTLYADRAVPWAVAAARGVQVVRVFTWDAATIAAYNAAPATVLADLAAMCTAAAAQGVQLILSPRLDKGDIEALNGGGTYGTLALAQQAMVTSGSTPWNTFEALLEATVDALDGNPGVYSYEVTNEPPYMLGADAGNITVAQLAAFLGHFNGVLKTAGAARVNLGSWPLYDHTLVSDAHLITMHTDCDLIDGHFYPPSPSDPGVSTAAEADTRIASHEALVTRVRTLLSRPSMPVMIGEVGDTPDVWFQRMMSEAVARGWLTLAWGYDAYDVHAFNVDTLPQVLEFIAGQNVAVVGPDPSPALGGFNWPNATRVYVNQWDQGSPPTETLYINRAVPWADANAHQVQVVRAFWWDEATINTYNGNQSASMTRLEDMLDAAEAQGVQLLLSPLLDRDTVERLNNSTAYGSLALAQQAMVTPGSTPWNTYETLLEDTVPPLIGHPGLYGIEAVNEPGYALGSDAGTITLAEISSFLGHFVGVLKSAGAHRVTFGSWPHWDPINHFSDAQITTMYTDCSAVDGHFYPPSSDPLVATAAHADGVIASHEAVIARVRTVLGRPSMPATITELGSTPTVWFEQMMSQAAGRGWRTLAWGYACYDSWAFDDDTQPQVLDFIEGIDADRGSFLSLF